MNCKEVYETGLLYHHYANTAYPLTPTSFMKYKLKDNDEIREFVVSEWEKVDEICLYIHIPFCQSRCKFCEYVVLENHEESVEDEYVELLLKEMKMYSEILKDKIVVGYDLGGGTPTRLSLENLKKITAAVNELFNINENVIFSIETTPVIAANEPEKIKAVYDMGYRRISMGVQTVSEKLLESLGRDGSKTIYERAVENIRNAGFERFNIDLMYGFLKQSERDFDNTLKYAIGLKPEFITLYRNRYKGTKIEGEAGGVSIYKAMYQYRIAHRVLNENGYIANCGKNTFSRVDGDYGTSDYLTKRVIEGTPYVGMGLGAQSFGMNYLAYNMGAADKRIERYKKAIENNVLPFQDIYRLPIDESIAKMVSVAFYFGFVDMNAFKKRFDIDFCERFKAELEFVFENELMEMRGERLYLTERGSDYINGVIPLFYSDRSKEELKTAFIKQKKEDKTDEELFLSTYDINQYERPSVTADIVAFSVDFEESEKNSLDKKISVLMVKRGEHPYMNCYALPGGFVKSDETVEECAVRELEEEANIRPETLMYVGVFSEPDRDPRGRIISNAYMTLINKNKVKVLSGDDAIDARWFEISFEEYDKDRHLLILKEGEKTLKTVLKQTVNMYGKLEYEIENAGAIAFDHAKIIINALEMLYGITKFFNS